MNIGSRLLKERTRLGLSQPAFADLGGTTKQTLYSWEKGTTTPPAAQLAKLAEHGVDVLYVLTGQRSGALLSADEAALLLAYQRLAPAHQHLVRELARALAGR